MKRTAMAWLLVAVTSGCAIHSQGPIKEVAYDFSDADFYDRAYAPSPQYLASDEASAAAPASVIDVGALPAGEVVRLEDPSSFEGR